MGDSSTHRARFRFKSKPKSDSRASRSRSRSPRSSSDRRHHRKRRRHRHEREESEPHSRHTSPLRPREASPDTAFRESLFDALADDEGAAYWEGVYGQPIHNYSRYRESERGSDNGETLLDEHGNPILEKMTDEEYTSYVRARMWEKSHAYLLEEREKRRRAREQERHEERKRNEAHRSERERAAWEGDLQEALLRRRGGAQRKKESKQAWERYKGSWERLDDLRRGVSSKEQSVQMPWPTTSGLAKDISQDAVESFYRAALPTEDDLAPTIKAERIKWHPDKIQQLYGHLPIKDLSTDGVTAVFQIIDRFWVSLNAQR